MKKYTWLLGLIIICLACENDIPQKKDFPILQTLEPLNNDASGAMFRAKVLQKGNVETSSFGFVWSLGEPSGIGARKTEIGSNIEEDYFEKRLEYSNIRGETYNIRAYADYEDKTVYGNIITIVSE